MSFAWFWDTCGSAVARLVHGFGLVCGLFCIVFARFCHAFGVVLAQVLALRLDRLQPFYSRGLAGTLRVASKHV